MKQDYIISAKDREDLLSLMHSQLFPIELHLGPSRRMMWADMIDLVTNLSPNKEQNPQDLKL